jgi:hypothetical protein
VSLNEKQFARLESWIKSELGRWLLAGTENFGDEIWHTRPAISMTKTFANPVIYDYIGDTVVMPPILRLIGQYDAWSDLTQVR